MKYLFYLLLIPAAFSCHKKSQNEIFELSGNWELIQTERYLNDSLAGTALAEPGAVQYEFSNPDEFERGTLVIREEGYSDSTTYVLSNSQIDTDSGLHFEILELKTNNLILSNSWNYNQLIYSFNRSE